MSLLDCGGEGVLTARALVKRFRIPGPTPFAPARTLYAVNEVDLDLAAGECLALVGESGCGKSTTAQLLAGLLTPDGGSMALDGTALQYDHAGRMAIARRVGYIFQNPGAALNPRFVVRQALAEPLVVHGREQEAGARVSELLAAVGLDAAAAGRYPHEFSGGQRQRLAIARALALNPQFIIADEPTASLDVSIQGSIVNLLLELKRGRQLGLLLIAHDLCLVRHLADRVAVMYLGAIVETATNAELYARPRHPYTRGLLAALPKFYGWSGRREELRGEPHAALTPPHGCVYADRCPHAQARCRDEAPALRDVNGGQVACHFAEAL